LVGAIKETPSCVLLGTVIRCEDKVIGVDEEVAVEVRAELGLGLAVLPEVVDEEGGRIAVGFGVLICGWGLLIHAATIRAAAVISVARRVTIHFPFILRGCFVDAI